MTREELDEWLRAYSTDNENGFDQARYDGLKQLIRECIEAVTPEQAKPGLGRAYDDGTQEVFKQRDANNYNWALFQLKENTKELLG